MAFDRRLCQVEIARHAADYRELLPILFAEERHVGANLVEQFEHNSRNPIEMPGPVGST